MLWVEIILTHNVLRHSDLLTLRALHRGSRSLVDGASVWNGARFYARLPILRRAHASKRMRICSACGGVTVRVCVRNLCPPCRLRHLPEVTSYSAGVLGFPRSVMKATERRCAWGRYVYLLRSLFDAYSHRVRGTRGSHFVCRFANDHGFRAYLVRAMWEDRFDKIWDLADAVGLLESR